MLCAHGQQVLSFSRNALFSNAKQSMVQQGHVTMTNNDGALLQLLWEDCFQVNPDPSRQLSSK